MYMSNVYICLMYMYMYNVYVGEIANWIFAAPAMHTAFVNFKTDVGISK